MDGLWSVLFSTPFGSGFGVAVFTDGQIVGGDSQFYWFGTYSVTGSKIQAELRGHSHSGGAVPSVLGGSRAEFSIQLVGTAPADSKVGAQFSAAGGVLSAVLTRRS